MAGDKLDFFISYCSLDKPWAEWIAWWLQHAGYSVLVQLNDFFPGRNFVKLIDGSRKACDRMLAVVTPNYLSSPWTESEWTSWFAQDPAGRSLLLVRVQDCAWDAIPMLSSHVQVDLVGLSGEEARDKLLRAMRQEPSTQREAPPFPPAVLRLRNIPVARDVAFSGRADLFSKIKETLTTFGCVALVGLAGVGKTGAAVEHAYRCSDEYSVIWWFAAETTIGITEAFESLATAAGLKHEPSCVEAVKSWLRDHAAWLLVFDNAPDRDFILPYLPSGDAGHVLITSRDAGLWGPIARTCEVPVLARLESTALLARLSESEDAGGIAKTAEMLGDLPIALRHAGAYVAKVRCSWEDYIESFWRAYMPSQLTTRPEDEKVSHRPEEMVAATWLMGIRQAQSECSASGTLMNLAAFFGSDTIPRALFKARRADICAPDAPVHDLTDLGRINDAIAALRQYSLLRADFRSISVHRLVQQAVHRQLSESARVQWVEVALRLLYDCLTLTPQDESVVRAALVHMLSAACLAEVLDAQPELRNSAWNALREQLGERFHPSEIERHLNTAIDTVEGIYGRSHEKLVLVYNRLGGMMAELGQPRAAAQYYQRAQAIASSPEFRRSYDDGWKPMYPPRGGSAGQRHAAQGASGDLPVRVLMVASEAAPFAKTGGLADVLGSLPPALADQGEVVAIVLPRYRGVSVKGLRQVPIRLPFEMGSRTYDPAVFCAEERGVTCFLIDIPELFDRDGLYGDGSGDYADNHIRFGAFCRAAVIVARDLFRPEVVHAHDWQAALVPALLRQLSASDPLLKIPVVFTVHNLGYQGLFERECLREVGLPDWMFHPDLLEFFGGVNFLKAGIVYSDHITTVSSTYAREIQSPEFGFGLDGLLRTRADALTGILNGVDYATWDPQTDKLIPSTYGPGSMGGKRDSKRALLNRFGLSADRLDRPLIGIVSRLAAQKGFDLLGESAASLLAQDITLVVLGAGERKYEEMFLWLAAEYPERVGAVIGYDNALSHLIEAGSDMFLMPSRYEPCGLNQMYSLRYGSVPIVRATGGLDDSVDENVGFKFAEYSSSALLMAVAAAVVAYGDRDAWEKLVLAGMARDYSWSTSAAHYSALYRSLVKNAARP